MSIEKRHLATFCGKDVYAVLLDNENGLKAEILTYGGIVKNIWYKDVDLVLGRDTLEGYFERTGYMGALIGRNSNRIRGAEFELNGKVYNLAKNEKCVHNIHGGNAGFNKKVWDFKLVDSKEPSLVLTLVSPDLEEGFPGEVNIKVTYTLTKENGLKIHYEGTTDKDTILNMTNHTYFNLNGYNSGLIDDHTVWIDSNFYTPNMPDCIPSGEILSVKGTPFDFNTAKKIREGFESNHEQIKLFGGYDHNFVLENKGFRKIAEVEGDITGIKMEVYTDRPGVQFYTGNSIKEHLKGKDGINDKIHSALCLETQCFPDSTEFSHFTSAILRKEEKYDTTTEYRFI